MHNWCSKCGRDVPADYTLWKGQTGRKAKDISKDDGDWLCSKCINSGDGLVEFYSPENCRWYKKAPYSCWKLVGNAKYGDWQLEEDCSECPHFEPILTHRDLQDQLESALEDMNQDKINGMEE
jgi:hypothetical protein